MSLGHYLPTDPGWLHPTFDSTSLSVPGRPPSLGSGQRRRLCPHRSLHRVAYQSPIPTVRHRGDVTSIGYGLHLSSFGSLPEGRPATPTRAFQNSRNTTNDYFRPRAAVVIPTSRNNRFGAGSGPAASGARIAITDVRQQSGKGKFRPHHRRSKVTDGFPKAAVSSSLGCLGDGADCRLSGFSSTPQIAVVCDRSTPRDIYIPDQHIDTIKVKSRNFH